VRKVVVSVREAEQERDAKDINIAQSTLTPSGLGHAVSNVKGP
jgi:hypothetical protein